MFVKNIVTVYTGTNINILHDSTSLYTGTVDSIPFYFLNETIIEIRPVNATTIALEI